MTDSAFAVNAVVNCLRESGQNAVVTGLPFG